MLRTQPTWREIRDILVSYGLSEYVLGLNRSTDEELRNAATRLGWHPQCDWADMYDADDEKGVRCPHCGQTSVCYVEPDACQYRPVDGVKGDELVITYTGDVFDSSYGDGDHFSCRWCAQTWALPADMPEIDWR